MLNTRTLSTTCIALCGLIFAARPAHCSDLVLEPCADSFIISVSDGAKYNYGTDPVLFAYNDGNEHMNVLLQFKTGKVKSRSIRSARLRLWCNGWQGDFINKSATTIYALAAPWEETQVSWYQASDKENWKSPGGDLVKSPSQNSGFAVNTQGVTIASGGTSMMEWDVTDLVRLWTKGTLPNYGLRLDAGDGIFLFESRESPYTQMHPQLILDFGK